ERLSSVGGLDEFDRAAGDPEDVHRAVRGHGDRRGERVEGQRRADRLGADPAPGRTLVGGARERQLRPVVPSYVHAAVVGAGAAPAPGPPLLVIPNALVDEVRCAPVPSPIRGPVYGNAQRLERAGRSRKWERDEVAVAGVVPPDRRAGNPGPRLVWVRVAQ